MSGWPEKVSLCDVELTFVRVVRNGECNLAAYKTKSGSEMLVEEQIKQKENGDRESRYMLFSNQTPRFL
jgi:hypothetical protein